MNVKERFAGKTVDRVQDNLVNHMAWRKMISMEEEGEALMTKIKVYNR